MQLWDTGDKGYSNSSERVMLAQVPNAFPPINSKTPIAHGLFIYNGYLYASSSGEIYRWNFSNPELRQSNLTGMQTVITNIWNTNSSDVRYNETRELWTGFLTRTILIDQSGTLYVQVGARSQDKIDENPWRACIKSFSLSSYNGTTPLDFNNGADVAIGVRNTVAMALDMYGVAWGVDQGFDDLLSYRADLFSNGLDIVYNPADKVVKLSPSGQNFGYSTCWAAYNYTMSNQTMFGLYAETDTYCQNTTNVTPPSFFLHGHSSVVGMTFYDYSGGGVSKFPSEFIGDAFLALRGSAPGGSYLIGYRLLRLRFLQNATTQSGSPYEVSPVLYFNGSTASVQSNDSWARRMSGVAVGRNGQLFVSDDAQNMIYVVSNANVSDSTPTPLPTVDPSITATPSPSPTAPDLLLGNPIVNAASAEGYDALIWARDLTGPRTVRIASNGDVVVVNKQDGTIMQLWDTGDKGYSNSSERVMLAQVPNAFPPINSKTPIAHGLFIYNGYLYASSSGEIYRWNFSNPELRQSNLTGMQTVITNIWNTNSSDVRYNETRELWTGFLTRTILIDQSGTLYVQVGARSQDKIDENPWRACIKSFSLSSYNGTTPLDFNNGADVAIGVRNTVAMALDMYGVAWGVDQGFDDLLSYRADLFSNGLDIVYNPADKVVKLSPSGQNFGYSTCWAAYNYTMSNQTMFGLYAETDTYCQNTTNVTPPSFFLHGHSSVVGMTFYDYSGGGVSKFPSEFIGDAFLALRGSAPGGSYLIGYRLLRLRFLQNATTQSGSPYEVSPVLYFNGSTASVQSNDSWKRRMAGVAVGRNGELFVTDDQTNEIYIIKAANVTASTPSPTPILFETPTPSATANVTAPTTTPGPSPTPDALLGNRIPYAKTAAGYDAFVWASGLLNPRSIITASNGDIVAVNKEDGSIIQLWDSDGKGYSRNPEERVTLATVPNGSKKDNKTPVAHGLAINRGYLYASSSGEVYRWDFTNPESRVPLGNGEKVITGIWNTDDTNLRYSETDPSKTGFLTRTIFFDGDKLYIQVGARSKDDVDTDIWRAHIRLFDISSYNGVPLNFSDGTLFVKGVRNTVAIAKDALGNIWGVDQGFDNLFNYRQDLNYTGGISAANDPADKLNLLQTGSDYGYSRCWFAFSNITNVTSGILYPSGTAFGLDSTMDAACRNTTDVTPPMLALPGHLSVIGMLFYLDVNANGNNGLASDAVNDLFLAARGSVADTYSHGYAVKRVRFRTVDTESVPLSSEPFLWYNETNENFENNATKWDRRMTGLTAGLQGELYVSDDNRGSIYVIKYTLKKNDSVSVLIQIQGSDTSPLPTSLTSEDQNKYEDWLARASNITSSRVALDPEAYFVQSSSRRSLRSTESANLYYVISSGLPGEKSVQNVQNDLLPGGTAFSNLNQTAASVGVQFVGLNFDTPPPTAPSSTPTLTPSPSPVPPSSSSGLSGGAIAGIVIGVICGVIILVLLIMFLCSKVKTRRNTGYSQALSPHGSRIELRDV